MRQYLATGRGRVVVAVLLLGVVVAAWAVASRPSVFEETSYLQVQSQAADSAVIRGQRGPAGAAGARGEWGAASARVAAERVVTVERPVVVEKVVEVAVEKVVVQESSAKLAAPAQPRAAASQRAVSQEFATSDRQIIRNGTLVLMVADLEDAVSSVRDLVAGIPGAFFANSEIKPVRDRRPSVVTLRIPAGAFDEAVADLKALAVEVLEEQTRAEDVTEAYTDLHIRLRNLEAAEEQFLVLFKRAEKVQDILEIQDRLQRIRGEIERLRGQLNVLENRVALATVRVQLHPPPDLSLQLVPQGVPFVYGESAFRLTYRNDGSVRAKDVVVTLDLPEQAAFVEARGSGIYDPATRVVTWEISELHPSDQGTFVAVLRFESAARVLALDAAIHAGTPDADDANNAATARLTFEPDLTLTVLHAPSAVAQGDMANLALLYGNAGNGDAEQVSIQLSLPTGLTFVSAIGGRYDADKRIIVWDLDRVRPHEENHIEASVRVDVESGRLPLSAVIAAVETERVTYNNRADMSLAALPEDVSGRTVWSPGQTFRDSFETLGDVARGTVDLLIWVSTFVVPLAVIVGVVLVPVMLIRRRRRRAAG